MNMSAQAIDDTCYLKEIQNYADLTAGMLGYTLPPCAGQERIRRCHKILSKYPYAYPLALELSLLLPSAMAITWLRAIHSTFYARADVLEEIDTFLVWRMSPVQALTTILRQAGKRGLFLPSLEAYLQKYYPSMARYIRKRRAWDMRARLPWRAHWDTVVQHIFRVAFFVLQKNGQLPEDWLAFYLRAAVPRKHHGIGMQLARWAVMRLLTHRVTAASGEGFRREWWNLPVRDHKRTAAQPTDGPGFDVVTVLWGERYVDDFAKFCMPSLLASGNLPALASTETLRLVFYTTHKDMARIQALPHYEELRRHADVRFIFIDTVLHAVKADIPGFNFTSKYAAMTAAHNHSLRSAARNGRYVIITPPDSIWQKDTFVNLLQLQKQGKNNIFLYTGPFICRQYIDDIINKCMKNGILELDEKLMRSLMHKYRHPISTIFHENFPIRHLFSPLLHLFSVGDEGVVAYSTCHLPLMLKPTMDTVVRETVDYDCPISPLMLHDEVAVLQGNALVCIAGIEPLDGQDSALRWPPYGFAELAKAFRYTRLWNRLFLTLPCKFSATGCYENEQWNKVTTASRLTIDKLLRAGEQAMPLPPVELFLKGVTAFLREYEESRP